MFPAGFPCGCRCFYYASETPCGKCPGLLACEVFFDREHDFARVDAPRADKPAFAAEHAFRQLFVSAGVFAPAHEGLYFTQVERCEVSGRTGGRAVAAGDAGLQFGVLAEQLPRVAQVVLVEVDRTGLVDRISEIHRVTLLTGRPPCRRRLFLR